MNGKPKKRRVNIDHKNIEEAKHNLQLLLTDSTVFSINSREYGNFAKFHQQSIKETNIIHRKPDCYNSLKLNYIFENVPEIIKRMFTQMVLQDIDLYFDYNDKKLYKDMLTKKREFITVEESFNLKSSEGSYNDFYFYYYGFCV